MLCLIQKRADLKCTVESSGGKEAMPTGTLKPTGLDYNVLHQNINGILKNSYGDNGTSKPPRSAANMAELLGKLVPSDLSRVKDAKDQTHNKP